MVEGINDFMNEFYSIISFRKDENFKSAEFAKLFYKEALLIEKIDNSVKRKTVDEHTKEFEYCIENYPHLFTEGFAERQLKLEYMQSDDFVLVKSQYEKRYSNGKEVMVSTGYNNMTLLAVGNSFEIVSIAWKE